MYIKKSEIFFFGFLWGTTSTRHTHTCVLFCIKDLATYNLVHYFGLVHLAIVLHSSKFAHSMVYKVNGHGVVDGGGWDSHICFGPPAVLW
jgi:hypothetical protein